MTIDLKCITSSILLPYKRRRFAVGEVDHMETVPDDYMKTVVFLCVDDEVDGSISHIPKATGFFVRVRLENTPDCVVDYVVTARHCVEEARPYGQIYIRQNRKVGSFIEYQSKVNDWFLHDNADVAAIRCGIGITQVGFRKYRVSPEQPDYRSIDLVELYFGGG